MSQAQNHDFNSNSRNNYINGKKLTAIISVTLIIAVVAILSEKSYASISGTTNHAAFFVNPFNNILERDCEKPFYNDQELTPDTTGLKKGIKKFHFYEKENGDRVHYKAKLKDGKLTDLYVDGEKVPENELDKYEAKVQAKIDEYEDTMMDYKKDKDEYKKFTKEYSAKMKEYRDKMKNFRREHYDGWDFDFDSHFDFDIPEPDLSELREAMKELRRELKENLADGSFPPIHIPRINIPPIHIHPVPPVHIDKEEWREWSENFEDQMEEFKDKMKDHKWDMEKFNENMKDFGKNMKKFGVEMKKFGNFVKEMKDELIDDGIIDSGDEIDELVLSEDKMEVNGKAVSTELHKKYLNLYEKHTGKKIDGDNKIRISN